MCQEGKIFRRNVTDTSTVASDLGTPGEYRIESDGRKYQLVQAGSTVAIGAVLQLDAVSASVGYIVDENVGSNFPLRGINNTGASHAANAYFFALVRGSVAAASLAIGSDVSMATNVPLILNSDTLFAPQISNSATNLIVPGIWGQNLGASRASDATTTQAIFIHAQGA
jgi:hypothetical protein